MKRLQKRLARSKANSNESLLHPPLRGSFRGVRSGGCDGGGCDSPDLVMVARVRGEIGGFAVMTKLSKEERQQLKMKFGGKCAYCGCELIDKKWHADHVEPIYRKWWEKGNSCRRPERDCLANLVPACSSCNIAKSVWNVEQWRAELAKKVERLNRYQKNFRLAVTFGQVQVTPQPIVFYFEQIGVEQ